MKSPYAKILIINKHRDWRDMAGASAETFGTVITIPIPYYTMFV